MLVADVQAGGGKLSLDDLAAYQPRILEAGQIRYRDAEVFYAPGLTAGPSLARAFELLSAQLAAGTPLNTDAYRAYTQSLLQSYTERLATMGDSDSARQPSCTTHLSVVDKDGNFVALTQTLLSVFGSRVMLPQTGILMNNGIMWFDPRPGRPNSIAPGKKPLSNMCPTIVRRNDGLCFALGASGGRRIMPAVFQLCSFLVDHRLDINTAFHQARIDVSGSDTVTLDATLPCEIRDQLAQEFNTLTAQHGVYPALFACPNLVAFDHNTGVQTGAAYIPSPWAQVSAA
jgi:gamma-glutamyltranspeptidase/glutathione hydrolase